MFRKWDDLTVVKCRDGLFWVEFMTESICLPKLLPEVKEIKQIRRFEDALRFNA